MQQTNWVVLTGGPSAGKSTLLENLRSKGYTTMPESARVFIDEETAKGKTLQELRADEAVFQKKVLEKNVEIEGRLNPNELVFLDRGIPDSIAYYQICGADPAPVFKESQKRRYGMVFLCEQVPFVQDHARTEDQKKAEKISKLLYEAYTGLGYEVIKVPLMSVEERVQFVLNRFKRL